jgi:hypothetical protein
MLGSLDTGPQIDEVVGKPSECLSSSVRPAYLSKAIEQRVK